MNPTRPGASNPLVSSWRGLAAAALLGLAAPAGAGGLDCADAAAQAVQKRYEGVRDVRARFEQVTEGALVDGERSRGEVVLAKPGRMRWSYESPRESLVVSDGETLWLYDPEFGEAQKLPAGQGFLSGAAARVLLGEGDMRRDFEVTAVACGEREVSLELVPRAPASYEKLFLTLDPASGDIRGTRVVDLVGNTTSVAFQSLQTDTDPPAETFRFDPPEGVEVIELAP